MLIVYLQFNLKRGGQRVATMLMYLTDGVEGGETHFPQVSRHCQFIFLVLPHVVCSHVSRDLCWPDIGQHLISAPGRRRSVQLRRKHCPRTVRQAKQRRCCSLLEHGVLFSLVLVILHQSIVFRCAVFLKTPCSRDTCSPPTTNADLSVCFRDWMVTRTRTASTAGAPF